MSCVSFHVFLNTSFSYCQLNFYLFIFGLSGLELLPLRLDLYLYSKIIDQLKPKESFIDYLSIHGFYYFTFY